VGPRTILALAPLAIASLALVSCASDPTPTPTLSSPSPTPSSATLPVGVGIPPAPDRNLLDLVARYLGNSPTPLTKNILYRDETVGTQASFWILNVDGPKMHKVEATLQHVSDSALWYVANSIDIASRDLERSADAFEDRVLPAVLRISTPDLTLPGKITIVNTLTPGLAGYFASSDALPTSAQKFSNERVMMVMNSSDAGSERYLGTLAHELQHLIQWHIDSTEETWVAEGLAEFAVGLLNLPKLPNDAFFSNPGVSLSNWPEEPGESIAAYAAGSLLFSYLHARTGLEGIQQIVREPRDGVDGMNAFFESQPDDFSSFFGDWLAANVARAVDGPYAYIDTPSSVRVDHLLAAPGAIDGAAPQLGGWYLRIDPGNIPLKLRFDGASSTPVLPVAPHSGDRCWWGNRGDGIDSTLTRTFDLRGINKPTLRFWSWYAIENGFDRGYVAASTDKGESWRILEGGRTTNDDPIGTSMGPSYTGESGGWMEDQIDLTLYAGSGVLLRFNYVTDDSINTAGWCIDDISIPEAGFADDAEVDIGWRAEGFASVHRDGIPQRFELRTIAGTGADVTVSAIALDENNDTTFVVERPTVLVVGGLTHRTSQPGQFTVTATR